MYTCYLHRLLALTLVVHSKTIFFLLKKPPNYEKTPLLHAQLLSNKVEKRGVPYQEKNIL